MKSVDTGARAFSVGGVSALVAAALPTAALFTFSIQALRLPDGGFPLEKPGGRPLGTRVAEALVRPQGSSLECSVDEINVHLSKILPSRIPCGQGAFLLRAAVRLEGEKGEWISEHELLGRKMVLRIRARVWASGGRIQIQREGGSLGRLELGMWALPGLERRLERVWPYLKKEWALLNRVEGVRAEGGRVVLKVRPGTPVPEEA